MIDIHTHLLPGVDDGSPSVEASLPVLARFAADGVETVVCTPHLSASRAAGVSREKNEQLLAELAAAAPDGPRLLLGWEIMLDDPDTDLTGEHLTLGGSRALLVEFPRTGPPSGGGAELFRIRMSGRVPVLAHPERYWGCTADHVREWRRCGAVVQMDAIMLLGKSPMARLARSLLEGGLVDCMASDNHGDTRSLTIARRWLREVGAEHLEAPLLRDNAARLLANEETLPVPPLARQRGMFERLRELAGIGQRRTVH